MNHFGESPPMHNDDLLEVFSIIVHRIFRPNLTHLITGQIVSKYHNQLYRTTMLLSYFVLGCPSDESYTLSHKSNIQTNHNHKNVQWRVVSLECFPLILLKRSLQSKRGQDKAIWPTSLARESAQMFSVFNQQ